MSNQLPLPPPPPPPQPLKQRPIGITILAILLFIAATLFIIAGLAFIALGPLIESLMRESMVGLRGSPALISLLAGAFGIFFLVVGAIVFVLGWGLWTGKGWAWWLQVILTALGALSSLLAIAEGDATSLVGLLIDALIIYYFFKPHVKDYFGVKVSFST